MAQLDGQPICESPRSSPSIDPFLREGHQKKSVLTKVKEKAKKLKHSLTLNKKKHPDHDDNTTPSWGVSLEEEEEDDHEEDSEYLGAPMYESDYAPESYKAKARRLPRAVPEHRVLEDTSDADNSPKAKPNDEQISPLKTIITKTAGQNESVSDSPRTEAPNHVVFVGASPQRPSTPQTASLTGYLLSKIEPAEEDRALSRVISAAATNPCASPRASDSEPSVVEKVREAVVSLLRNDQPRSPSAQERPAVAATNPAAEIASLPGHSAISADAREVDGDNIGRVLQAN